MKRTKTIFMGAFLLLLTLGRPDASGYTHPCIPQTAEDLAFIKANLNQEPWKSGYARLAKDSKSQLGWTMEGPFAQVSRQGSYDANLGHWQNDMKAVYNLARMWYFTGNGAYAQKAHDILIAWATTNTTFNGDEAGLAMGDHAADTTTVKNYFLNVLWPNCQSNGNVTGDGQQWRMSTAP